MNKKIQGIFHIDNTDSEQFNKNLFEIVNKLQEDKQEVEVQFKVNAFPNGQLVYSALIMGRR